LLHAGSAVSVHAPQRHRLSSRPRVVVSRSRPGRSTSSWPAGICGWR